MNQGIKDFTQCSASSELFINLCGLNKFWELVGIFSILSCFKAHCTCLDKKLP